LLYYVEDYSFSVNPGVPYLHAVADARGSKIFYFSGSLTKHSDVAVGSLPPEFTGSVFQNGRYQINPIPKIDFWGNEKLLMEDLESINWMLSIEKREIPTFLTGQRDHLAIDIHDLFWVGHSHHQPLLLTPLHEQIKASAQQGCPVVLFGNSAGSMIAANYALYRIPYIDLDEYRAYPRQRAPASEARELVARHPAAGHS
jgi:hypothetical protein